MAREPDDPPVLVGRASELGDLVRRLELLDSAGAQFVLVEGEPGIGKSALARSLAHVAAARGYRVLSANADELGGRRPFGLLTDCLGQALESSGPAEPLAPAGAGPRVSTGPGLPAQPSGPESMQRSLAERSFSMAQVELVASDRAIEVVEELVASAPLVMVLEDLHWADPSSLFVLRRLHRHASSLPVAVVCTARLLPRPAELHGLASDFGRGGIVSLGPLERPAVDELAVLSLGASPGPNLRAQVDMAGGNPLFVLEMIGALRAEGLLHEVSPATPVAGGPPGKPTGGRSQGVIDVDQVAPPPSLLVTLLHRLSFLPAGTLRLLGLAAVLGTRFGPARLADLAGEPLAQVAGALGEATRAGLLRDQGDDLAFSHELVREALYDDIARPLRSALHREAARVLSGAGAPAGIVAEHLLRGAEPGDEEAASQLAGAARSLAEASPAEAVELLTRAVELCRPASPLLLDMRADLAVAMLWSGDAEAGEAACRQALVHGAGGQRRAALQRCLVESLLRRGQVAEVVSEVQSATGEAVAGEAVAGAAASMEAASVEHAPLLGMAAMAQVFLGHFDEARALAEKVARAGAISGITAFEVQASITEALVAERESNVLQAVQSATRAVALAESGGSRMDHSPLPQHALAMFLVDADRFADALSVVARGIEVHESFDNQSALPILHVIGGFARFWSGDWDLAEVDLDTGLALAGETGTGWRAAARGLRAIVALGRTGMDEARRQLALAESELAAGEAGYRLEWLALGQALCLAGEGRTSAALGAMKPVVRSWLSAGPSAAMAAVAPAAVRFAMSEAAAGAAGVAHEVAGAASRLAEANPTIAGIAASDRACRAAVARDAVELAACAEDYRRSGRPFEAALASEEAAAAFAAAGRRAESREALDDALGAYDSLGAPGLAGIASLRLAAAGVHPRRPAAHARDAYGWGSLTASEQNVLRLLAERRSNKEIATELTISRRTVETHVSHILAKTGLSSRIELADGARRHFGWRLRLEEVVEESEQA